MMDNVCSGYRVGEPDCSLVMDHVWGAPEGALE